MTRDGMETNTPGGEKCCRSVASGFILRTPCWERPLEGAACCHMDDTSLHKRMVTCDHRGCLFSCPVASVARCGQRCEYVPRLDHVEDGSVEEDGGGQFGGGSGKASPDPVMDAMWESGVGYGTDGSNGVNLLGAAVFGECGLLFGPSSIQCCAESLSSCVTWVFRVGRARGTFASSIVSVEVLKAFA